MRREETMLDHVPGDLPNDLPGFLARFGSDEQCRDHLVRTRWPDGFRCGGCGPGEAWSHRKRLIEECRACGRQHSILAGTMFEQTKTGLARWFLAIHLVTASKGGISASELQRQMGFASYQTAWSWLHKIRNAMIRPGRDPLKGHVEVDETLVGAAKSGPPGRGALGKSLVVGAIETGTGKGNGPTLGRLRLQAIDDAGAPSLEHFLATSTTRPIAVTTDGWRGYSRLKARGYTHKAIRLSLNTGNASQYLPAIHLVFGLAKRWLLGTHHGAVRAKHLQRYLNEFAFRFNRRTATKLSHGFARLVQYALQTPPITYSQIVRNPQT
jgi:transposase-like protein